MINIKGEGIILRPGKYRFEKSAVYNPTCIDVGGIIHMFYRACDPQGISTIGYCRIDNNKKVQRSKKPVLYPEFAYEKKGIEDPRIVNFEGKYYLFYTVYDGRDAMVAYAESSDLVTFKKMGIISPKITYDKAEDIFRNTGVRERYSLFEMFYKDRWGPKVLLWEKDTTIFPKRIKGKIALMHRILPGIQIMYFNDFAEINDTFWKKYLESLGNYIILDPYYYYESRNIGGGAVPIETKEGWLLIYHAVEDTPTGKIYHAAAALVDRDNPQKVIGRLKEPLFSPKEKWEKVGRVNNVVFPSGAVVKKDELTIYYGAADTVIGAKSLSLSALLRELKNSKV